MMYGVRFGDKHSVEDYGAIMNYARITPPAVKENYVDIAGGNSSVDLTEAVSGVTFEDGSISFMFTLYSRQQKDRMKDNLHGKRLKIILERDPDFYYDGRLSVTKEEMLGSLFVLYIEARVYPYKMENHMTIHTEDISFRKEIILLNSRMPTMPTIIVKGRIRIAYSGISLILNSGEYQIPEITLYEGINRLEVSGDGNIQLKYRKGMII